jgi:hypothetical protein
MNFDITENTTAEQLLHDNYYSNILVYNEIQWAAHTNDSSNAVRQLFYQGHTFLETSNWAVVLQPLDSEALGQ